MSEPGNRLAKIVGPFYDTIGLSKWLNLSQRRIAEMVEAHQLIRCTTSDDVWIFPTWQFTDEGEMLPGLAEVVAILATGTDDSWTWGLWLSAEVEELEGMSAIQWLTEGRDNSSVLQSARHDAWRWAH